MVIYAKGSGPIVISTSKTPDETIQAALIPQCDGRHPHILNISAFPPYILGKCGQKPGTENTAPPQGFSQKKPLGMIGDTF